MADEMLVLPGERCRRAREEQGLSTTEAANRLHLSVSYLRALEADDYERLPEATFVKGYLRNYAKLLGLPADEIANTFQQMVNEDRYDKALVTPVAPASQQNWRKPLLIGLGLLLLVALVGWLLAPSADSGGDDAHSEPAPVVEDSQSLDESAWQPEETAPAEPQAVAPPPLEQTAPEIAEPAAAQEPEEQIVDDGIDRLVMQFSANCWLRITDNQGQNLYEGEQPAGATLEVEGERPFSLVAGNAGAISTITLNGEAVTLPTSARGSVVRTRLQ